MNAKWVKDEDAEGPDGRGYWHTTDGQWRMSPLFRHTVNPSAYRVVNNVTKEAHTFDTVREAKDWPETSARRAAYAAMNAAHVEALEMNR